MSISRKKNQLIRSSEKAPLPISTLHIPGKKVYVVNSPHLIQAVQKQPKALSFRPIEAKLSGAVCGLSQKARDLIMKNVNGTDGNWGISAELYPLFKESLKPGKGLNALNNVMIRVVGDALDSLAERRHFATNEVLALVSMFFSRFEIEPTKGTWKIPKTDNTRVQTVIMEPDDDIEVSIFTRGIPEGVKWKFGLRDSTSFLAMANEDKL
ncbi:hypothetical protein HYALB_00005067 [Hymenoscyphus albidus]|uniref:Uncharacterized protein n=1 Tax=Hymenoscyphus albidus TaxID=595503 RepID=A0A9N9LS53_9HELO|nr:hypothetical protein HYALB_00005067 [Hymenoscyphus albidus]